MENQPLAPNNLDAYWMPFTPNRDFKRNPSLVESASGMHYRLAGGQQVLDGIAGLWCSNAGHSHPRIVEAIRQQVGQLDFISSFGISHPQVFDYASRLTAAAPAGIEHAFFTNSGSEAVDTAIKMAIAYHQARGQGQRQRIVGRQRGYHGVNMGGLSAGGMGPHKRQYGTLLPGAVHLPHTHDLARNAFSKGQPANGMELADALEDLVATYDASSIAAVIVEPIAGSTGVLVPPIGYLQRLRELCTHHGIVLIFDEVVTGFGRLGEAFAAQRFGVTPDLMTIAKGMTSGMIPMGGVLASAEIFETIAGAAAPGTVEFSHGYTYSGHPMAVAAAAATLRVYQDDGIFEHASAMEPHWEQAAHALHGLDSVIDIRNLGLLAGIELGGHGVDGKALAKAVYEHCLDNGVLVRPVANTIALSPPLIISEAQIEQLFEILRRAIVAAAKQ